MKPTWKWGKKLKFDKVPLYTHPAKSPIWPTEELENVKKGIDFGLFNFILINITALSADKKQTHGHFL